MANTLIERKNIDIRQYPQEIIPAQAEITLGDLHGNALKLLHFLFMHGIVKFKDSVANPEDTYHELARLYDDIAQQEILYRQPKLLLAKEKNGLVMKKTQAKNDDEKAAIERQLQAIEADLLKAEKPENRNQARCNLIASSAEFIKILASLEVVSNRTLVRLIGDEVSDRGSSDYLTLELLALLQKNRIPVRILVSNHGSDFVAAYEAMRENSDAIPNAGIIDNSQKNSLLGLQAVYEQAGGCSAMRLGELVDTVYKPSLRLLDFTLEDDGITLFTHAPVRFSVLRDIAEKLEVVYQDDTKEALGSVNQFSIATK